MAPEFVPLEFVFFEERHLDAVRRFNQRLIAGHANTPFFLDEKGSSFRS